MAKNISATRVTKMYVATSCSICSLPISRSTSPERMCFRGLRVLDLGNRGWDNGVRALRSRAGTDDPFLTGIGVLKGTYLSGDRIQAHDDPDRPLVPGDHVHAPHHRLVSGPVLNARPRTGPPPYLAFPLHDFCWQVLSHRAIDGRLDQRPLLVKSLFKLLSCTPRAGDAHGHFQPWTSTADSFLRFDRCMWKYTAPEQEFNSKKRDSQYIMADPTLHGWELSLGAKEPSGSEGGKVYARLLDITLGVVNKRHDIFATLPAEVKIILLSHTPSADINSLRLASRSIAQVSRPGDLPQSFWASRFEQGREMAFYRAAGHHHGSQSPFDWHKLYGRLRSLSLHKNRLGFFEIRNRRHIFNAAENLTGFLAPLLSGSHAEEYRHVAQHSFANPADVVEGGLVRGTKLIDWPLPAGGCPFPDQEGGTVQQSTQVLWLPIDAQGPHWSIGASFCTVRDVDYMSGIRILSRENSPDGRDGVAGEEWTTVSRAGMLNPEKERRVALTIRQGCVGKLRVASSVDGVVGLAIMRKRSCTHGCPPIISVGESLNIAPSSFIGVAELVPRGKSLHGIKLGLDACKIVSIQLLEGRDAPPAPAEGAMGDGCSGPLPKAACFPIVQLWSPRAPANVGTFCLPEDVVATAQPRSPMPLEPEFWLNMAFGGTDGSRLPFLSKITVYFIGWSGYDAPIIRGVGFSYDDTPEETVYGSKKDDFGMARKLTGRERNYQKYAAIDGRQGERIIGIHYSRCEPEPSQIHHRTSVADQALNFSVSTNFGRRIGLVGICHKVCVGATENLVAPEGEVITGILARANHPGRYISDFGIHSRPISDLAQ